MTEDNMLTINKIRNEEFNNKSTMIKTLRTLYILMAFALLPAFAAAQGTRYYVALKAVGTGNGSSWNNATTLDDALAKAKANDEIWVMGYNDEGNSKFYFVPTDGYTLKSGVKLYGGFNGKETSIGEREVIDNKAYRMVYRTVLSGDIGKNDVLDATNLIFPGSDTRTDNATHVLTLNMTPDQTNINNWETVVDGVTIAGGHAVNGQGGGIFVKGNNDNGNNNGGRYILRRCFFIGNYAGEGGALYVASTVKNVGGTCLIDRCGFFNNAAGQRSGIENAGGAVCLAGAGTIVNTAIFNNENGGVNITATDGAAVVNSTVTRNTGSGIDGKDKTVNNTVIWGNSLLSTSDDAKPAFNHCAYPEANADGQPDDEDNIYLDSRNNEAQGPHFDAPSVKTGFDTDYMPSTTFYPLWTWVPLEGSNLIDKGDNDKYDKYLSSYGNVDLDGNPRQRGSIDIGAFEYQPVSSSRIRYVNKDGTGDGTGSSWDNASANLQAMIDELAESGDGQPGEVWVAAGEYEPLTQLIPGTSHTASFRMRNGVSVYGGFAGGESSKTEREKVADGMPWQFVNKTILSAAYYSADNLEFSNNKWTTTSDSRHVVWFAPMDGEADFTLPTYLDGVTVRGGYAQGGTGLDDFKTDRGAGVYMDGENTYLVNSTVTECYATGNGGGVYLRGGRVQTSLIYNNNADQGGGAVYVDGQGLVHRSMLANNSARNGAGAYLNHTEGTAPEYLVVSTCVVSNNTSTGNGAIYCNGGGVLLQNTIVNNRCVTATDLTDPNASQTGGLYLNGYGLVVNSVIWNNRMGTGDNPVNIPMYARNPSADNVRFMYNAISGVNNAVWNNTLQQQTLSLVDANKGEPDNPGSIGPRFEQPATDSEFGSQGIDGSFGVLAPSNDYWKTHTISYFWQPIEGSNLWARGMPIGQMPSEVVLSPEIDIAGGLYAQKPAVGAFHVDKAPIVPALENNTLVLYIDADCTEPDHDGSSWAKAYRSINDAISFFATLNTGDNVDVAGGDTHQISDDTQFEIRVLEGDLWPRYAFVNEDPKTATLDILAMQSGGPLKIVGGYYRNNGSNDGVPRDPLNHRSQLNGNPDGDRLEDGLYHVVTVEPGAKVELDGFHVINGYAAGTASLQYGAGMLVRGNADVTLTNCIFENNTAANGAAIYAADANHKLTMRNCVVNNNTNTNEQNQIIVANNLTLQHVTVVNNLGAAPDLDDMGATSFSAGNTSGNSLTIKTTGEDGAANFANPTNKQGATLGFNTYLGGYASFRPLTSSADAGNDIINKASDTDIAKIPTDITTINDRNLGGVPDLGAYEADLPKAGTVIYVRDYGERDLSKENRDGSSWDKAINGRADYGTDDGIENDNISNENVYVNGYNIIGLQYAVNQAYLRMVKRSGNGNIDYQNANVPENKSGGSKSIWYPVLDEKYRNNGAENDKRIQVWVGAGEYTSNAGLFMRDGVDVYGGFPNSGNPGMNDRNPRINETFLKAGAEGPELRGYGDGNSNMPYFDLNEGYDNANTTRRVLTQPLPYYDFGQGGLDVERTNIEVTGFKATTIWNGFTITDGCTHINHQREGGAGVALRQNGVLENCVIKDNVNSVVSSGRGGGIFCNGGTLINCMVESNELKRLNSTRALFGGGIYLRYGTTYNCVYGKNKLTDTNIRNGCELGSAIYIERGNFFNNTVVDNEGCIALGVGKYFQESQLNLINCIVYGNKHPAYNDGVRENSIQIGRLNQSGIAALSITNCCIPSDAIRVVDDSYGGYGTYVESTLENSQSGLTIDGRITSEPQLVGGNNYELSAISPCINAGKSENLTNEGEPVTLPSSDMNYTNRIKDCTVDIGAYERDNEDTTFPDANGVYYVTFMGFGNASADSPENAACADKLQTVLNAAGERAKQGKTVIVKVAGYADDDFVYHANTLADKDNPQSYTFVVPDGVTLEGGYFEGTFTGGVYDGNGWDEAEGDNVRNAVKFRTVLSATAVPAQGSTITQEVTGYHAVTFGGGDGTAALANGAVIDGVWLVDGSATSMAGAGNPATMGGGAIVPGGAHVRNCVVMGNQAVQGGGLYVMPGGTVSGTAILGNTADKGGGVYAANKDADGTGVTDDNRAHIISCTIADNTADDGGGLYLEDGASMQVNTVIWGNTAQANKNVSGVTNDKFTDTQLGTVFGNVNEGRFFPFNDCFVESQEMPSDFENASLESDADLYFTDDYRRLKDYSLMIKHGVKNEYQQKNDGTAGFVKTFNVAQADMQGIDRIQTGNGATRLDAGAFAYEGGVLPTDLMTRIFVSQVKNVSMPDGAHIMDYLGKSFYTSFSTLEDALGYIRSMRKDGKNADVKFEILVAGGTYKPTNMRETTAQVTHDQRLYSFEVPAGVSIYGGFEGTEMISSKNENGQDITRIPGMDGETFACMGEIEKILSSRKYSDFNQNNLLEPWELASQTILSGQINVSGTEQNAYHVVFSDADGDNADGDDADGDVLLDGLTVMYGKTDVALSTIQSGNEQGRGGGIYSNGVNYTLRRCRVIDNIAVRGGGVFVRNADLNLTGCILAGNRTVANEGQTSTLRSRGGAAYVAGININKVANLRAVNTLWANNESAVEGGAIGTNYAEGVTSYGDPMIDLMNNTFVKNKAKKNPVIFNHNGKSSIVNTLIWGNEGKTYDHNTDIANMFTVSHSASDVDYAGKFAADNTYGNILLDKDNMGENGPRLTSPSTEAGVAGNSATNLWNPVAISVTTDAGDGVSHTTQAPEDEQGHEDNVETGEYKAWFEKDGNTAIPEAYISTGNGSYSRYSGPRGENNEELCKTIDIGVYEYQYISNFSTMDKIYVDTISRGTGSGESWMNATDQLREAIVGAANPTDNLDNERFVYVRDGEYSWDRLSAGMAYILNMADNDNNKSLTLKGSCTGSGDQQDFSKQTVVRNSDRVSGTTAQLMNVNTNSKPVTIEGFTFINADINAEGDGMSASTGKGGSLTLKSCAFRGNRGSGLNVADNSGRMLIYNTLFADGGTGLTARAGTDITLVNTTFANNETADMSEGLTKVYNSTSWNKGTQNMPSTEGDGKNNKVFAADIENADIHDGPNFVDPDNTNIEARDYHIRPSLTLLNQGSNENYAREVLGGNDGTIPAEEVDLGNNVRLVDKNIDIGAYEYEAPLQPIAYVKADVVSSNGDGKSWQNALSDLQGAADLVGIYAQQNNTNGYVFVHRNVKGQNVSLTLDNTKVYGGMNDETTTHEVYPADGTINTENVTPAVTELLGKRVGLIERASANRSTLSNVTVNGSGSVVDGFEVNGTANIQRGYLSTSIINTGATISGAGVLYNSLVHGDVATNVKAVNVTATGTVSKDYNNRPSATDDKAYIDGDDEWKYQLMETSNDIDKGKNQDETGKCINAVGHDRDIAGNKRIRNTVDNGCFETWDINTGDSVITAADKPHGKSVVYVRAGKELSIEDGVYAEGQPFNPGVLLLEHQAGLRGGGNSVALSYVIVERNVPKNGVDMAYVPFTVNTFENENNVAVKSYDAAKRAAYDFKFDGDNGTAWTDKTDSYSYGQTGLLLDNTAEGASDAKVRFIGKANGVYTESADEVKQVTLDKNNFEDPWTVGNEGTGKRFTHKENMSWNLFGSPYLCAMNYDDMEYGRVIYGYQNDNYVTVNTDVETTPAGHIPAGDAVFTQTATLKDYETFGVSPRSGEKSGGAYENMAEVKLSVARTGETRSADGGAAQPDVLQLGAVEPGMARTDFDMGADGVKWMADGVAQIYAVQGGGRYSLLSAVNVEGKVAVGVSVPEAGMYTIAIPESCVADGYETVVLEDNVTHKTVNLLEGGYDFTAAAPGDIEGRFTVSFNRMVGDKLNDGIRAYSVQPGVIRVEGVAEGDRISVYSADGIMVAQRVAASSAEDIAASVAAVAVVKVERDGKTVKTVKLKIKN